NMDATGVNVNPTRKEVTVQLGYMAANQFVAYGRTKTLNESNGWSVTFDKLPTYALADPNLTLTDGSDVIYAVREVASDGSYVDENGSISLGTDNRFTVTYTTSQDGKLVVTNTFDSPEKYYYRVDRHYSATINGSTTTEDVVGDLVTVLPSGDRSISIGEDNTFDVDASAYLTHGKYTYTFDHAAPAEVQVLELPNHEYVIHLYYVYTHTSHESDNSTFLNVKKVWKGDDAESRPDSIQVQLLRDGEPYGNPKTLSEANNWKTTWSDLSKNYDWSVEEVEVPDGYICSVSSTNKFWTITNTLEGAEIPEEPIPEGGKPSDPGDPGDPADPGDSGIEIPDTEVPKADVPKTGDNAGLWLMAAAASGLGLVWMTISGKKRKEENA
ncbi:MAG: Cna B-type domain-containing protein, partial [Candidatus Onthomonas sp.]|nr:Cna B-type domain-containing protein [Candidatus Onthomonas sp.]